MGEFLMDNLKHSLILNQIEQKRHEMFECAKQKGIRSNECIKKSQELDRLIVILQKELLK